MKKSRISTRAELDAVAKKIKEKSQAFGKASTEKYAREAQKRIEQFCKGRVK